MEFWSNWCYLFGKQASTTLTIICKNKLKRETNSHKTHITTRINIQPIAETFIASVISFHMLIFCAYRYKPVSSFNYYYFFYYASCLVFSHITLHDMSKGMSEYRYIKINILEDMVQFILCCRLSKQNQQRLHEHNIASGKHAA